MWTFKKTTIHRIIKRSLMLNTDTKHRIDIARDILVGKVPGRIKVKP